MAVNLQKGQKVDLTKGNAGLNRIMIGLGWDEKRASAKKKGFLSSLFAGNEPDIDCDASVIMCKDGKFVASRDLVYFGNLSHHSDSVVHSGDNLTGGGDGDDEQIFVSLEDVPREYDRLVVVVNIYQAMQRNQHFGMIQNAFIRIVDTRNNTEMCRYNLSENYESMYAMIFGELYRSEGEWKFNAIGQATKDNGLEQLTARFKK